MIVIAKEADPAAEAARIVIERKAAAALVAAAKTETGAETGEGIDKAGTSKRKAVRPRTEGGAAALAAVPADGDLDLDPEIRISII